MFCVPTLCSRNKAMNQINYIMPYLSNGQWVFDDSVKQLDKEALVGGMPEIIGLACAEFNIKDPHLGFGVLFSASKFKGHQFSLKWVEGDGTGNTYLYNRNGITQEGWLCPALFKYFDKAPKEIFIQVRSIPHTK